MPASLSFYSNIFGFIVGGISLLGAVVATDRAQLPSNKIKILEEVLRETEDALREAVEDGLLGHEFTRTTESRLAALKDRAYSLRSRAHGATSIAKDCVELFNGTSTAIGSTCQSLRKLKAEVISSSEERRGLIREGTNPASETQPTRSPTIGHLSTEPQRPLHVSSFNRTCRSRSCPPPFSRTCSNFFSNAAPSDSDVGTIDAQSRTSAVHTSVTLEPIV